MRIYKEILGVILLAALFVSCNKCLIPDNTDKEIEIELNGKSYIQFSSGITTKGALFHGDYLDNDFNVLGYQYRSADWGTASMMATPNVFVDIPQLLDFHDGIYTYENPQIWTGNNYSFFGYFPIDNDNIVLFDNGTSKQGKPYITYTLPSVTDPTKMLDVMTSCVHTRLSYDSDGNTINEVSMTMKHRLSAIDIRVRNHYTYKENVGSQEVPIVIEMINLTFKPKTYTKAKIYLDDSATEGIQSGTLSYSLVKNNSLNIDPTAGSNWVNITNDTGNNPTTFLLVPQNSNLEGTLDFSFKLKNGDNYIKDITDIDKDGNVDEEQISISYPLQNLKRTLVEGRRYYIEIYFSSDAVSIDITTADEWDEESDVIHEFE